MEAPWTKLGDLETEEVSVTSVLRTNEASGKGPVLEGGGLGVGQKIAVHVAGEVMAYVPGTVEMSGGGDFLPEKLKGIKTVILCFLNVESGDGDQAICQGPGFQKFLVKAAVRDLSFAHHFEDVILGVVDVFGNVVITSVMVGPGTLDVFRLLTVNVRYSNPTRFHAIRWCPFVSDSDPASDFLDVGDGLQGRISRHLVVVNNNSVEVWNLDGILHKKGDPDPDKGVVLQKNFIKSGRVQAASQPSPVVDVCVSPDCNFFACLLEDGTTNIFDFTASFGTEVKSPTLIKTIPNPIADEIGDFGFITVLDDYTREAVDNADEERLWATFVIGRGRKLLVYDAADEGWPVVQRIDVSECLNEKTKATKDPAGKHLVLSEFEGLKSVCLAFVDSKAVRAKTFQTNDAIQHSAFVRASEGSEVRMVSLGERGLYEHCLLRQDPMKLSSIEEERSSNEASLKELNDSIVTSIFRETSKPFRPIDENKDVATTTPAKIVHLPTPIKVNPPKLLRIEPKIRPGIVRPSPVKATRSLNFDAVAGEPKVCQEDLRDSNNNPEPLKAIGRREEVGKVAQSQNSAFRKIEMKRTLRRPKETGPGRESKAPLKSDENRGNVIGELTDELRSMRFNQAKMPGLIKRTIRREFERRGFRSAVGSREHLDHGSCESVDGLCTAATFKRVFGVLDRVVRELENKNQDAAWEILSSNCLDDLAELDVMDQLRKF